MKPSRSCLVAATLGISFILSTACGSGESSSGSGGAPGTGGGSGTGGKAAGGSGSGGASGSGGRATGGSGGQAGASSGRGGQAGTSSTGGASSCGEASNVVSCGGDVSGTWSVSSSCVKASGELDLSSFGIGCTTAPVTGGNLQVKGAWTATAEGKLTDATTTTGDVSFTLDAKCLEVSGTTTSCEAMTGSLSSLGFDSVDCQTIANGGCACDGVVNQKGSPAMLSVDPQTSGKITTSGNAVTYPDDTKYSYCVAGDKMTWSPQSTSPTLTGTVVFQKSGSSGSGGAGQGGQSGAGGAGGATSRDAGQDVPTGGGGGSAGSGGAAGAGGLVAEGPCDIYAAGNTPCVAAYSMVRLLSNTYSGPLYQVRKGGGAKNTGTGGTTQDIGAKDGFADSAAQDSFCGSDTCTVSVLYDQSGKKNDLKVAKKGCYTGTASEDDYESSATKKSLTISGHSVYGLYMNTHEGYRNNDSTTMPANGAEQGIYEIVDGKHATGFCCWDFGTASKDNCYTAGTGSMNALFFGGYIAWGKGAGSAPWFMADFEGGTWAGGSGAPSFVNTNNPSMGVDFAFGILKTNGTNYAIKVGNAQSGALTTANDGNLPFKTWTVKGGIILGIGGDNSNSGTGTFFEGAILSGRPTDDADNLVFKNVQAAKYGQ